MKIKDKAEFLNVLKRCLPGISDDGGFLIEGADSFLFDGKRIYSYNDYIFASVPFDFDEIKKDEVVSIKAKKFYDFLCIIKGNEFELSKKKEFILVTSNKLKASFNFTEQSTFSSILSLMAEEKEWKELTKDFVEGLSACIIPNNLTDMKGVFVNGDEMISTDRKRICIWKMDREMERFMISDESIKSLIKMEGLEKYAVEEEWIHFKNDFGTYFSVRKMSEENFPVEKVKSIIKSCEKSEEDLENKWKEDFLNILNRSIIFTTDAFDPILFKIRKDFVMIKSSSSFGAFSEKLDFEKSFDSEVNLDLWFFPSMLIKGFKNAVNFYFKSKGDTTIIVFYSKKYRLITSSLDKEEDEEEMVE